MLGDQTRAEGWKAQMDPLSYGSFPFLDNVIAKSLTL